MTPEGEGDFYDLTVHGTHNYVANGLVNHNSGKSFAAAHAVRELLTGREWERAPRFALVSSTLEAVRQDMIEGALLQVLDPWIERYNRSSLEIFLTNGAKLKGYSSERPHTLRGPNFVGAWADEVAAWLDADHAPSEDSTWSNLEFATRADDMGTWEPRIIATTTPKPVRLLRVRDKQDDFYPGLVDDPQVVVTRMRTHDNLGNLAKGFASRILKRYDGTRLAAQELDGELLDEIEGALWTQATISNMRSTLANLQGPTGGFYRVVVSVDPTVGDGRVSNDECGIIVGALGRDGRCWVLDDRSMKGPPSAWCRAVGDAFQTWGGSHVLVETNQGGQLIRETLGRYYPNLPVKTVRAKDGKRVRAEGPALLCEQDRVRFAGIFAGLADQLTTWDPLSSDDSPDRLDAFVYLVAHLLPAGVLGHGMTEPEQLYRGSRGRRKSRDIRRGHAPRNPRTRGAQRPLNRG